MSNGLHPEIIVELHKGLDTFLERYGKQLEECGGDEDDNTDNNNQESWKTALDKIRSFWASLSKHCLGTLGDELLKWRSHIVCKPTSSIRACNWLAGRLFLEILTYQSPQNKIDASVRQAIMNLCFVQCSRNIDLERRHSDSSFFTFKSAPVVPTVDFIFEEQTQTIWRQVLGKLAQEGLPQIQTKFETELAALPRNVSSSVKIHFINNFLHMRLYLTGLSYNPTAWGKQVSNVIDFLRAFQPYMSNNNKTIVRSNAVDVVANILFNEISLLDDATFLKLCTSASKEWNKVLDGLHNLGKKLSGRRDYTKSAWDLRIFSLVISNDESFLKSWKEDTYALLRYQCQHKDVTSLARVEFLLRNILRRHVMSNLRIPCDAEVMECINTVQAWCFSISKQKNFLRFQTTALPLLVNLTLSIASYNMKYAIESHIRRLIIEGDSIMDERKLVGLEALSRIFQCVKQDESRINTTRTNTLRGAPSLRATEHAFSFDSHALLLSQKNLSDIVGQILIGCNTHFGNDLVLTSTKRRLSSTVKGPMESKRTIGVHIFKVAIECLPFLYSQIDLSNERKMEILARCVIHTEKSVREATCVVLHTLVASNELSTVCKGLSDYIVSLQDDETLALRYLLDILMNVLTEATSSSQRLYSQAQSIYVSLIRVEAMCVTLLCSATTDIRGMALGILTSVFNMRCLLQSQETVFEEDWTCNRDVATALQTQKSVMAIITEMDLELQDSFCPTVSLQRQAKEAGGVLFMLSNEYTLSSAFRWSNCLAVLFSTLQKECPLVTTSMWNVINAKAFQLEPIIPSVGEHDPACKDNISRWRNYALFACATANLSSSVKQSSILTALNENVNTSGEKSVVDCMTKESVELLVKRLCRFLKSPSTEQQTTAVLSLGNLHKSVRTVFFDKVSRYENEAFFDGEYAKLDSIPENLTRVVTSRRGIKLQKKKLQQFSSSCDLQWAVSRCYRSIIEKMDKHSWKNNAIRIQVLSLMDVLHTKLTVLCDHALTESRATTVMMKHDFCASIKVIIDICNTHPSENWITSTKRELWFSTLKSWCEQGHSEKAPSASPSSQLIDELSTPPFIYTCFGNPLGSSLCTFWYWKTRRELPQDVCNMTTFLLHRIAYPTMASLMVGPSFLKKGSSESLLFQWVDDVLSTSTSTQNPTRDPCAILRHFVRKGLYGLITNNASVIPLCLQKCMYAQHGSTEHAISVHYLEVLSLLSKDSLPLLSEPATLPTTVHIVLLHFGNANDRVRQSAKTLADAILTTFSGNVKTPGIVADRHNDTFLNHVMHREKNRMALSLSDCVPHISYTLLMDMLVRLRNCDALMTSSMLRISSVWICNIDTAVLSSEEKDALLELLLNCTASFCTKYSSLMSTLWTSFVSKTSNLLHTVHFLFFHPQLTTRIEIFKNILWWICGNEKHLHVCVKVLVEDMKAGCSTDSESVVEQVSRGILLIADITSYFYEHSEAFVAYRVHLVHYALALLYANMRVETSLSPRSGLPRSCCTPTLHAHCSVILKNMLESNPELCTTSQLHIDALMEMDNESSMVTLNKTVQNISCTVFDAQDVTAWAVECTDWFAATDSPCQPQLFSRCSMHIYKELSPSFDGLVLLRVLGQLSTALEKDIIDTVFITEVLYLLVSMARVLPPMKVVLYPQLFWGSIAALKHASTSALILPGLQLLRELFCKPTFYQTIVQDVFIARRPTQWAEAYASVQRAVMRGLYEHDTEPVARELLLEMLMAPSSGEDTDLSMTRLLMNTASLLPWCCRLLESHSCDLETVLDTALNVSHLWEIQGQHELAMIFTAYSSTQFDSLNAFLVELAPAFMRIVPKSVEEPLFDLLLGTVRGPCDYMAPTLLLVQALITHVDRSSPILHTCSFLFSSLTKLSREEDGSENWNLVLPVLSTAVSLSTTQPTTRFPNLEIDVNVEMHHDSQNNYSEETQERVKMRICTTSPRNKRGIKELNLQLSPEETPLEECTYDNNDSY